MKKKVERKKKMMKKVELVRKRMMKMV